MADEYVFWCREVRNLPEKLWRGRWDRRSKIIPWCCGDSHLGRYLSRKVIAGMGKVWSISVTIRSMYILQEPAHLKHLGIQLPTLVYCVYAKVSSRTSASGFFASRPLVKLSSCCMKPLERHSLTSSV